MSEIMSVPAPPTPPGWYPNPSGAPDRQYWDGAHWWPLVDASPVAPPTPVTTPTRRRPNKYKALGLAAAMLLAIVGGGLFIAAVTNNVSSTTDAARTSPPPSSTPRSAPPPTVSPADLARQRARLDPATYQTITPREFALIVKDPEAHAGEKIVVYGVVSQFDSATGPQAFRAYTAATPGAGVLDFDENTVVLAEDSAILTDVVEGDLVTMWVEVDGTYSYTTQLGGQTTVPQFSVYIIEVTDSVG